MIRNGDGSRTGIPLGRWERPNLRVCRGCSLVSGFIDHLLFVDSVGDSVGGEAASEYATGRGVVGALEVLDDVVFDERVGGPTVDGDEVFSGWEIDRTTIGYRS